MGEIYLTEGQSIGVAMNACVRGACFQSGPAVINTVNISAMRDSVTG